MAPQQSGASQKNRKTSRKKPTARKSAPANKQSKSPALPSPSSLLSLDSINNLRSSAKQWLKYLQQADVFLDTLYSAGNSLNETGVLQKIIQQKGKNLSTGDFTSILMALMNTPLADRFFKGGKQEPASSNMETESQAGPSDPPAASPQAQSQPLPPAQPQPGPAPNSPNGNGLNQPQPNPWQNQIPPGYGPQPSPYPGYGQQPNPYPGFGQMMPQQPGFGQGYGQGFGQGFGQPGTSGQFGSSGQPGPSGQYPGFHPGPYHLMNYVPSRKADLWNGTWAATDGKQRTPYKTN